MFMSVYEYLYLKKFIHYACFSFQSEVFLSRIRIVPISMQVPTYMFISLTYQAFQLILNYKFNN